MDDGRDFVLRCNRHELFKVGDVAKFPDNLFGVRHDQRQSVALR